MQTISDLDGLQAANDETGTAREMLADFPSSHNRKIVTTMEEKILQEIEELKSLTLLAAKSVLTIDDVALLTGISKSTLYKMTCKKQLPHYKPNSKLLFFDRKEIEEWAKQNRVNTWAEAEQKALAYSVANKN